MLDHRISRRHAVVAGSAAALVALSGATAGAQPVPPPVKDKDKDKKKETKPTRRLDLSRLLTTGGRHDWTLKIDIDVNAYVERDSKGMPVSRDFKFDSAAIVFPVLKGSASHRVYKNTLVSKLTLNDVEMSREPTGYNDTYPCGTRLAKWEMKEKTGREVRLQVDIPMTCWQTKFDEPLADVVPWPSKWAPTAASTFNDVQAIGRDRGGNDIVLINHASPVVQDLLKKWTNNKDPKSIAPTPLAKFLAGQILEYIQPSGDGLRFQRNLGFEGFDLIGAENALKLRRGTEHDIACALTAMYRAAGLPARLVIGYDINDEKGKDSDFLTRKSTSVPDFRTWVEFCLYDEAASKEIWVPVDVNRQRKVSSRNTKNWRFFGDNDELENVMPIAHQFHPPTTVISHGSPCFWGWITFPEAQIATQFLRFNSLTTPKTANSNRERQDGD